MISLKSRFGECAIFHRLCEIRYILYTEARPTAAVVFFVVLLIIQGRGIEQSVDSMGLIFSKQVLEAITFVTATTIETVELPNVMRNSQCTAFSCDL